MPPKDPERNREYQRQWREENRERKRAYQREYNERNRERIRDVARQAYARDLEKKRSYGRDYWAKLSPEERWAKGLKQRHGMYPAQYHAMYQGQGGKCYLCLLPLPEDPSKVAIDHDHGHCGRNRSCVICRRGLACMHCNTAIGMLGDSPERLRIVADNLERAQAMTRALIASAPQQDQLF
jgi:hypothetical protein